jgi:NAD(P)-dependent dehydrogenase (short-subunit alcohol dehydrogenase family)
MLVRKATRPGRKIQRFGHHPACARRNRGRNQQDASCVRQLAARRKNMRALVTGSSRGIGKAIALRLAADSAANTAAPSAIVLSARTASEELEDVSNQVRKLGVQVLAIPGDIGDPGVPQALVTQAVGFAGGLDVVVSNAGITSPGPLASLELERWDLIMNVNVRGPWLLARAAYNALKESRGTYLAIASMSGLEPHPGTGAYSASKAALAMLCRQLALEWGPDGIRANAICPGMVRTPMTESIYQDPEIAARRDAIVPLRRVGKPQDIAGVVSMLASDDARYITGETLRVDGGFSSSILSYVPGLAKHRV